MEGEHVNFTEPQVANLSSNPEVIVCKLFVNAEETEEKLEPGDYLKMKQRMENEGRKYVRVLRSLLVSSGVVRVSVRVRETNTTATVGHINQ